MKMEESKEELIALLVEAVSELIHNTDPYEDFEMASDKGRAYLVKVVGYGLVLENRYLLSTTGESGSTIQ